MMTSNASPESRRSRITPVSTTVTMRVWPEAFSNAALVSAITSRMPFAEMTLTSTAVAGRANKAATAAKSAGLTMGVPPRPRCGLAGILTHRRLGLYLPHPPRHREPAAPMATIMTTNMATKTTAKPRTKTATKTERPPLWKVILLNDDYTPREFVVEVLKAVFRMNESQAYRVMITAHQRGACVIAVYTKDVADTKAKEATEMGKSKGYPLYFTTEKEE